jgi:hypothetical protein
LRSKQEEGRRIRKESCEKQRKEEEKMKRKAQASMAEARVWIVTNSLKKREKETDTILRI